MLIIPYYFQRRSEMNHRIRCVVSAIMMAVLLFQILPSGFAVGERYIEGQIRSVEMTLSEPFALMVDERPDEARQAEEALRLEEYYPEGVPEELLPDPDEGKVTRFIVKYKPGRAQSVKRKIDGQLSESISIGAALTDIAKLPDKERPLIAGDKLAEVEITPIETADLSNYEVLILDEPVWPSEFADTLDSLGVASDIEYIQPDFELSFASLSLEILEPEGTEIKQPITETKPIETLVPGPEDTPDSTPEPAPEPEPEEAQPPEAEENIEEPGEEEIEAVEDLIPVVAAVIDTGVQLDHPMLDGYMHPDSPDVYDADNPLDYAHGTHISGIIASTAAENGADIQILSLPVFENGTAYTSEIIAAIETAAACGARIINCSFGAAQYNRALEDAIAATDALFVCAAGNARMDLEATPVYPACYKLPNVMSVGSVNADDGFSYFSNYSNLDITAYGREVASAMPGDKTGTMTGTSVSAAQVSAAAGCVLSFDALETAELTDRILASADTLTNLESKVTDGKRVNLTSALKGENGQVLDPNPTDDFDVHGYQRTADESWVLFSGLEIVELALGSNHSLALAGDGTVWAWGMNHFGQLGDGTTTDSARPTQVCGLSNIVSLFADGYHSFAIDSNGSVWAWGANIGGALGNGTYDDSHIPTQVVGVSNLVSIVTGFQHTIAIDLSGSIWAWGWNYSGQLGNGTTTLSLTPCQITGIGNIIAIAAGDDHSMALASDGSVWAWGGNDAGQLGDGTTTNSNTPIQVTRVTNIISISAGAKHSLALDSSGNVWAWGSNKYGQLGDGTKKTTSAIPVRSTRLPSIAHIAAGSYHSMAVDDDGNVWAWGMNLYGQLGEGTTTDSNIPVQTSEVANIVSIRSGAAYNFACDSTGSIWAWGGNYCGQLGDGSTTDRLTPVQLDITLTTGTTPPSGGSSIDLTLISGQEVKLAVVGKNISSFSGVVITVTYDDEKLQLMDAASQMHESYINTGPIPGTGITITSTTPGQIQLTFDKAIPAGKWWSGVVTVLSFSALTNGTANISV